MSLIGATRVAKSAHIKAGAPPLTIPYMEMRRKMRGALI
jgi:hypothetical protein